MVIFIISLGKLIQIIFQYPRITMPIMTVT